jgi:hypothetical protein
MTERKMVTLKDGNQVLEAFVSVIIESISTMPEDGGLIGVLAQYDLVRMAHDESYRPAKQELDHLCERGLARADGSLHYDIKSLVRCAFSIGEDGVSVNYSSPIKA